MLKTLGSVSFGAQPDLDRGIVVVDARVEDDEGAVPAIAGALRLRWGMKRDLALSFVNQLGGALTGLQTVRGRGRGQMAESRGGRRGRH